MPRFDGSGPMGQGSMTGRGMGYCNSNVVRPSFGGGMGQGFGRGLGRGFGRGMGAGFGRGFAAAPVYDQGYGYAGAVEVDEKTVVQNRSVYLKNLKKDIENELADNEGILKNLDK
ncbi:MAG: DUF5320 domain-containing protein [Clostridia bacterium]|nr:DUF5320 domain-containing protein [Clostridia bacterium]